jgi:large subunit ribosomal protein L30
MAKMLKITQVKSVINSLYDKHRPVMESLGFTKNQRTLYKKDTPQIRGMVHKVQHLVVWESVDENEIAPRAKKGPGYTVIGKGTTRSDAS